MKRTIIFSLAVGTFALTATSCMEIDNFDAPESRFTGSIIDVTTGKPILADQGHGQVRIWEVSFENADPQDIPIKQDGTYNNERLFPGHYDMCPLGSWWPCDTIRAIQLGTQTIQNFEVTPYLQVLNFEATHVVGPTMDTLILSCRLKAPIPNGMPNITDIRVTVLLYNVLRVYRLREETNTYGNEKTYSGHKRRGYSLHTVTSRSIVPLFLKIRKCQEFNDSRTESVVISHKFLSCLLTRGCASCYFNTLSCKSH